MGLALAMVLGGLLLGSGAGYLYWRFTAPKVAAPPGGSFVPAHGTALQSRAPDAAPVIWVSWPGAL
jgi:hypothetical protein